MVRFATCRVLGPNKNPPRDAVAMDWRTIWNIRQMYHENPRLSAGMEMLFNRVVNGKVVVRHGDIDMTNLSGRFYGEAIVDMCHRVFVNIVNYGVVFVALYEKHVPVCIDMANMDVWARMNNFGCFEYFIREAQYSRTPAGFLTNSDTVVCFEEQPPRLSMTYQNENARLFGMGATPLFKPGSKMESLLGCHMMMMMSMATLTRTMLRNSMPSVFLQPDTSQMPDVNNQVDLGDPGSWYEGINRMVDAQREYSEKAILGARETQSNIGNNGTSLLRPLGMAKHVDMDMSMRLSESGMLVPSPETEEKIQNIHVQVVPTGHKPIVIPESTTPTSLEAVTEVFLASAAAILGIPISFMHGDSTRVAAVAEVAESTFSQVAKKYASMLEYIVAIVFLFVNRTKMATKIIESLGLMVSDVASVDAALSKQQAFTVSFGTVVRHPDTITKLFEQGLLTHDATVTMLGSFYMLDKSAFETKDPRQEERELELMQIKAKMATKPAASGKRKTSSSSSSGGTAKKVK